MKRAFWSAALGNLFEHYDTALFGFLSPFLAPLIFPKQDPLTALILTYAILPLGMLARPLGALVFGQVGDKYGRERALFVTLAGMSLCTCGMALIPTYAHIGIVAPLLFCLVKACQNFFGAGEVMGGALYALEKSPKKRHDLLSSLYSSLAIGGHLLASLCVYLVSKYSLIDPGWRFLYLGGAVTALFGLLIRRGSSLSPRLSPRIKNPKIRLWQQRNVLMCIILSVGFAQATYAIAMIVMNGFLPLVTSVTQAEMMRVNTYLLLLDFCTLPLFGWLASKISREKLMLSVCLVVFLSGIPLLMALKGASLMAIMLIRMLFVLFGVAFFAPFHAWMQQLVPSESRYTVVSLGYALGSQLLGSPTALLALWCFKRTGMISSLGWYWMALALACGLSIWATMHSQKRVVGEVAL